MKLNTMFFRLLAGAVMILGLPAGMLAVTPEEMEEARTITARIYLRCANDGSDYLDKVSARTMDELEGKLKSKEKENLAIFKSFGVPADYASWTKDDLVKYWSGTFYANPQVKLEARGFARKKTEKALMAMKVKDPSDVERPKPVEVAADSVLPDAVTTVPVGEQSTQAVLDTLAGTMQPVEAEKTSDEGSGNTFYIVLLCVLVALVVALIIYAARMFKRQSDSEDDDSEGDGGSSCQPASNVNVTIAAPAAHAVADMNQPVAREVESLRAENAELRRAINDYKHHLNYVKSENTELHGQVRELRAELEQSRQAAAATCMPERYPHQEADTGVYAEEEPVKRPAGKGKTLYLGRANEDGMFVRAERELNPAHSIFRLVSTDGITGTFTVLESPAVESRIMADARQALRGGCDCDFSEVRGCTGVETLRGGTAVFDQGRWKVLRRAQVRFV